MTQDQIDSLTRSVCKLAGGILVAHGATSMAVAVNAPDTIEAVSGIVMAVVSLWASHTTHALPDALVALPKPVGKPMEGIGNP